MIGASLCAPQSGNARHARFAPITFAVSPPSTSTMNVSAAAAAVARTRRADAIAGCAPPKSPARTHATASVARSDAASAQCPTVATGALPIHTVTAPKSAVVSTSASATIAGPSTPPWPPTPGSRRARHATNAVAATVTVRISARSRCVHSMTSAGRSSGGNHAPWHWGHDGPHPIPAPEMRTIPPNATCTIATPSARRSSVRSERGIVTGARAR